MRKLLGVLIGVGIGFVITFMLESLGHLLFPMPPGTDISAPDLLDHIPLGAKLMVVAAWFTGALAGAYVGQRVGGWLWSGWVVVGILMLAGISTLFMIPHPLWMQAAALVAPILGGLVADRLPGGRVAR
ncbi:hypothetical protein KY084_13750 [Stakelama sp. CBK3Z-3]|uniref:Major facilitator superfamily (MFS) profile domain-containing protein n=1 Tax=Stakelama flava TaxID=2860338 RepID=A0ABS6XNX9_9SPHN|nr:hypothetical protein [Stakelama flava]MBW4331932.1 hypothetical protein [Stakelama flava]